MRTLDEELRRRDNDHTPAVERFEAETGGPWHQPSEPSLPWRRSMSVVIPAHDCAYSILPVLDALAASTAAGRFETIVVDDSSSDSTGELAADHPLRARVVRVHKRKGAGVARNVGTALAGGETVLFLDADMVLTSHVVHELAVRADDELVLIGFRHNVPYRSEGDPTRPVLPSGAPDIEQDHRVRWRAGSGRLLYSGIEPEAAVEGRPLDDTRDLLDLGRRRWYQDWDLPRMVVTAMVAVPRQAVVDAGGFEPEFSAGWGVEDTHLGAKLIAAGLKVAPMRQAVGFHIDPPDAAAAWRRKLALWPRNLELYRRLLEEPLPADGAARFRQVVEQSMADAEVLR
jgi:cellulose synthase/poly-beta-1,6-N-acetylglucosamine synthase-like glycosyltransferase